MSCLAGSQFQNAHTRSQVYHMFHLIARKAVQKCSIHNKWFIICFISSPILYISYKCFGIQIVKIFSFYCAATHIEHIFCSELACQMESLLVHTIRRWIKPQTVYYHNCNFRKIISNSDHIKRRHTITLSNSFCYFSFVFTSFMAVKLFRKYTPKKVKNRRNYYIFTTATITITINTIESSLCCRRFNIFHENICTPIKHYWINNILFFGFFYRFNTLKSR